MDDLAAERTENEHEGTFNFEAFVILTMQKGPRTKTLS